MAFSVKHCEIVGFESRDVKGKDGEMHHYATLTVKPINHDLADTDNWPLSVAEDCHATEISKGMNAFIIEQTYYVAAYRRWNHYVHGVYKSEKEAQDALSSLSVKSETFSF